jgi:hypothetical protein
MVLSEALMSYHWLTVALLVLLGHPGGSFFLLVGQR